MGVGIWLFSFLSSSFHWWYLLYPALLCASLHLGYGGDSNAVKIRKRFIYGLALGISAGVLLIGNANYALFGFHVGLCCIVSVIFGAFNISKNARSEETMIAFLSTVVPLFLI